MATKQFLCSAAAMVCALSSGSYALEISGNMESKAYATTDFEDSDVLHTLDTDLNLAISHRFNEKWSATLKLEAEGTFAKAAALYDGAFVQYTPSPNLAFKVGDISFTEGAIKYYLYDDEEKFAAGMRSHDIRGFEINAYGLQIGAGFARGKNDENGSDGIGFETYDVHLAYQLNIGRQALRAFGDYKSLQDKHLNELHSGIEVNLLFGGFGLHAVYGLHADQLSESEPKATHVILLEPNFAYGMFSIKGSALYSIVDSRKLPTVHGWNQDYYTLMNQKYEVPEFFFAYLEPGISFNNSIALGVPVEFHTNTPVRYKDVSYETIETGARLYLTPVEHLDITAVSMVKIPIGDKEEVFNNSKDNTKISFGAEMLFSF